MLLQTDVAYAFSFNSPFDPLNGIYLVQQIKTFDEVQRENIDLVNFLYSKVNLKQEDYESDIPAYQDGNVYKLSLVGALEGEVIVYAPESILSEYPDVNVKAYPQVMLLYDMGVFEDPDETALIATKIKDILSTDHGITTDPVIMDHDKPWMKVSDYETIVAEREATKGTVVNYYSTDKEKEAEIVRLQTLISNLEDLVYQLHNAP